MTIRRQFVLVKETEAQMHENKNQILLGGRKLRPLSIYIHIPFCKKKCLYCDFLSELAAEEEQKDYVEALLLELEKEAPQYKGFYVDTVFFGGGTPSLLAADQIAAIVKTLKRYFVFVMDDQKKQAKTGEVFQQDQLMQETEITIEVNPGTVQIDKLKAYHSMGINRLSIGLQSAQDEELKELGRIHTYETFLTTYKAAREAGYDNINIDLMSALPGQSVTSFLDTMTKVLALEPEHLSVYGLILEEGTPFYEHYVERKSKKQIVQQLPSEEDTVRMYEKTQEFLAKAGYQRYEISNYAKPGFACRHNCAYWTRADYAGFGIGAASMINNVRWRNCTDRETYVMKLMQDDAIGVKENLQNLSVEEQMEEFVFLGLRLIKGISKKEFLQAFSVTIESIYESVITEMIEKGLMTWDVTGDLISLTAFGLDVSNYVMAEFLLSEN